MKPNYMVLSLLLFHFLVLNGNGYAQVQRQYLNDNWFFSEAGTNKSLPADVTGSVHTGLMKNGIIGDPFYRTNEADLQWIGEKDWIYERTFTVDNKLLKNQNVELVFEGLDTFADVFLNGTLVLSADNMHRTWRINCKNLLKAGENNLCIFFHNVMDKGVELKKAGKIPFFQFPNNDQIEYSKRISTLVRKAGYHFGWDWGPRFLTSGIWKDVYIEVWNNVRIDGAHLFTAKLEDNKAFMTVNLDLLSASNGAVDLLLQFDGRQVVKKPVKLNKGLNKSTFEFEVENPKLWWSNGLGNPHLYSVSITLSNKNRILDQKDFRTGIRTVRVVHEPDKFGKNFYVELNGTPVFMKGANYIPNDIFLNRVTPQTYEYILSSAANANMNMIRVWGGGVFEDKQFYGLCDSLGLLVWQDMLFACGTYPGDEAFLSSVKHEVIDNVKRIRNHPSIALYCGNNEVEVAYYQWDWQKKLNLEQQKIQEQYMRQLFYQTIPNAIYSVDPTRYYHPTSPNTGYNNISHLYGDMHDWSVWHGMAPFETYNYDVPRFMSEYGFQSYPEFSTVKTFTIPEDWYLESEVMQAHQRCMADDLNDKGYGNRLIKHYMDQYYHQPNSFEGYLYVSQLLQAKGVKMAVEAHRRNMPLCMGTLYWQLNDCWPVASWASIDYEGKWKALHYTVREAYRDLLVAPFMEADTFRVYMVSDRLKSATGALNISLMTLDGEIIKVESKQDVKVEGASSQIVFQQCFRSLVEGADLSNLVCVVSFTDNNNESYRNIVHFVPEKELVLKNPEIEITIKIHNNNLHITLQAKRMAKGVMVNIPNTNGHFSDNYFDLLPGEQKTTIFIPSENAIHENVKVNVISLLDSYME